MADAMAITGHDARIAAIDPEWSEQRLDGYLVGSIDKAHLELIDACMRTMPASDIARIRAESPAIPVHEGQRDVRADAS